MKKILLYTLLIGITATINARQFAYQTQSVNNGLPNSVQEDNPKPFYILGYCSDKLFNGVGTGKSDFLKAAIQIPIETAQKFKGCKLTKLRIAVGDEDFSNTKIFLSYTKEGKPFYTQKVTFTGAKVWDEIELETPYEIEGKEFFIGYSLISYVRTLPVLTDDAPINPYGGWIALSNEWHRISEIQQVGNLSIQGIIEGDNLPSYDLSMQSVYMNSFVKPDESFYITSIIKNMATATIQDFDLIYQIGDNPPVTTPFKNINLKYRETYKCAVKTSTSILGKQQIKVWVDHPNGKKDENFSDNERSDSVSCGINFIQRKILLEHFATRDIYETVSIIENFQQAVSIRDHINWVTHFAGYAPDKEFTLPESQSYTWLYNQGSGYANGAMIDRTDLSNLAPDSEYTPMQEGSPVFAGAIGAWEWGEEVKTFLGRLLDSQLKKMPALITVDISKNYNETNRCLKLTVSGNKTGVTGFGELEDNLRLNVYLIEDKIRTDQKAQVGIIYYKYNNVLRKVLSETWGDKITFSGDAFSKDYEYIIPLEYNEKNMKIIAFVSNYDKTDRLNCQIYNSEFLAVTGNNSSNVAIAKTLPHSISIKDNTVTIKGDFKMAVIYDLTGKIVKFVNKNAPVFQLNKGIYLIKIDKQAAEKVVIAR